MEDFFKDFFYYSRRSGDPIYFLGLIAGRLYNTLANLDTTEEVQEYAAMHPFSYEMPEVVMRKISELTLFS